MPYTVGFDFGTNSVRALIVDVRTGEEVGTGVYAYRAGSDGILLDARNPDLARQDPRDYLDGLVGSLSEAFQSASGRVDPASVIGIGIDTTGSTPIPVDAEGRPLAFDPRFVDNLNAYAWLWKDHTAHAEAAEITDLARKMRPEYLAKCGGIYSSEWFWAKILHCLRTDPDVFDATATWVEHADWMPAVLTGTERPDRLRRGICAAGHKAMFHRDWGGYPDEEFLGTLDERLRPMRRALPDEAYHAGQAAGTLTEEWADRLGLTSGIPVSVGAFDAHLGAVGSGVAPRTLVKIIGTSTCDLTVSPINRDLADIPGLCGIVPGSVLPGHYGLEAGQSAVGDIFDWFVRRVAPEGQDHASLTAQAEGLGPGESGLLALDWHNGNRTVLVDQRLSGLILGLNLHTTPAEIYRALVEATAFGARVIVERYEEYGLPIERVVNCGGISARNPMVMQIYADVMNRPMHLSRSTQTCALGAAIAASVAAGEEAGGHADFGSAIDEMTGMAEATFEPVPDNAAVYDRLYALYRRLHDAFGIRGERDDLSDIMKTLLRIRDEVRTEKRVPRSFDAQGEEDAVRLEIERG